MTAVKYPDIHVKLTGGTQNAFGIMGAVSKALKHGDVSQEEIDKFFAEATSGDYNRVLNTCMTWVDVS